MTIRGRSFDLGASPAEVVWLEEIGSTNDYLTGLGPAPFPRLVFTWNQTEGRGRLGREWQGSTGDSLALSVDLGPLVPAPMPAEWIGTIPLLAGACLAEAVVGVLGLNPEVKWPNDVLLGGKKVAGVLGEIAEPGRVIIGIGLNVWGAPQTEGLDATSLREHGLSDPSALNSTIESFVSDFLARAERGAYQRAETDLPFIRRHLATLGESVRVSMPDGSTVEGLASELDSTGRLLVVTSSGSQAISAGDIEHLRTVP